MSELPLILIVNGNRRNLDLLAQFLGKEGYKTILAASLEETDQALAGPQKITLALLDLAGFDNRNWERCEQLQVKNFPFLIIYPKQSMAIQQESLARGARSVLVKPLRVKELLALIRGLLEEYP